MKYLVAIVVVVGLLWLLRLQRRRPPPAAAKPPVSAGAGGPPALMIRCAACGVHLAERDAVRADGEAFCSDEHRLEHRRRGR